MGRRILKIKGGAVEEEVRTGVSASRDSREMGEH